MGGEGCARVLRHPEWEPAAEGGAVGAPERGGGARCPQEDTESEGQRFKLRQSGGQHRFLLTLEGHSMEFVATKCPPLQKISKIKIELVLQSSRWT